MSARALPKRIRRYRILSELGHGAMGRVYLAEDPRIDRKIALKVLSPREITDPGEEDELRERFLLEARAAGRLIHPGIVTVFDADTDPASGDPYLAMEWVDGRTLRDILEVAGKLEMARAIDLVAQVAAALDYAHRQHVIHRDIKPANLLVTGDGAAKVSDFGIAKLRSLELTLPGHILGSPHYMAPEQVRAEPVDGRADLFALGVVLYECLTGELAFGGDSLANVTYKIVSVDPRPPEIYHPAIPPSLRAVLDRALQKRPEERFQTGAELERQLRAVAEEVEPQERRSETERLLSTPAVTAAKDSLPSSTVALTARGAQPADTEAPPPPTPEHPVRKWRGGFVFVPVFTVALLSVLVGWSLGKLPLAERAPFAGDERPNAMVTTTQVTETQESGDPFPETPVTAALRPLALVPEPREESFLPPAVEMGDSWTSFLEQLGDWESAIEPEESGELPGSNRSTMEFSDARHGIAPRISETGEDESEAGAVPQTSETPGDAHESVPVEAPESAAGELRRGATEKPAESPPPPPPPPPPVATALLEVIYENRLKAAYISLWVDGEQQLYNRMEARSFLKRQVGQEFRRTIAVPEGRHVIEVHVSGVAKKKIEARQKMRASFSRRDFKQLEVRLKKGVAEYELELTLKEP